MDILQKKIVETINDFDYPVGKVEVLRTIRENGFSSLSQLDFITNLSSLAIQKIVTVKKSMYSVDVARLKVVLDESN